jgi:hypothetical protein
MSRTVKLDYNNLPLKSEATSHIEDNLIAAINKSSNARPQYESVVQCPHHGVDLLGNVEANLVG